MVTPEKKFLSRVDKQPRPGGPRDGLMQELLTQGIMLKLGAGTDHEERNYATIRRLGFDTETLKSLPRNNIVNDVRVQSAKLIIHGRDLFASEDAYRRFKSGELSWQDPEFMALFHPEVLKKIEEFMSDERWAQIEKSYLAAPSATPDFDDIRAAGIKRIVERAKTTQREGIAKDLYDTAQHLSDPYTDRFRALEQEMAQIIVYSLKQRELRHILDIGSQFVIVDGKSEADKEFENREGVGGFYKKTGVKGDDDLVVVFAPGMEKEWIAHVVRHEGRHKMDLGQGVKSSFAHKYADVVDGFIASDRKCIDQWQADIENITDDSSPEALGKMDKLLALENLAERRQQLLSTLKKIQARLQRCMPRDPADTHPLYPTKQKQLNEIPTVLGDLEAQYGKALMQELVPSLYEATRTHRLTHPAIWNRKSKGPELQ